MRTTIGVEEEFVLLDPATLAPAPRAGEARDALAPNRGGGAGAVTGEFFPSQIEYASPVCTTAEEALSALTGFRRRLSDWAGEAGLIAAGVGAPYRVDPAATVTEAPRYRDIAAHFGRIVPDHQINGLHVHVGVADRDAAIRGLRRLRPWLPTLLALSANSPFWQAEDTGFDSWRAIHSRRWTTHGIPPPFRDGADYDRRTAALQGIGGTSDAGTLNWVVRPSERFPTLEVRVFDAQLDARSSVALAALVRGLVVSDPGGDAADPEPELLDSAMWHAAKAGLGSDLVDPATGALRPAHAVVHALIEEAMPGLTENGDADSVAAAVDAIVGEGNGAARQRYAVAEQGEAGLVALLAARP